MSWIEGKQSKGGKERSWGMAKRGAEDHCQQKDAAKKTAERDTLCLQMLMPFEKVTHSLLCCGRQNRMVYV